MGFEPVRPGRSEEEPCEGGEVKAGAQGAHSSVWRGARSGVWRRRCGGARMDCQAKLYGVATSQIRAGLACHGPARQRRRRDRLHLHWRGWFADVVVLALLAWTAWGSAREQTLPLLDHVRVGSACRAGARSTPVDGAWGRMALSPRRDFELGRSDGTCAEAQRLPAPADTWEFMVPTAAARRRYCPAATSRCRGRPPRPPPCTGDVLRMRAALVSPGWWSAHCVRRLDEDRRWEWDGGSACAGGISGRENHRTRSEDVRDRRSQTERRNNEGEWNEGSGTRGGWTSDVAAASVMGRTRVLSAARPLGSGWGRSGHTPFSR